MRKQGSPIASTIPLGLGKKTLAKKAFLPPKRLSAPPIPRPVPGYKTCGPAAHTKQVGWEILLERLEFEHTAAGVVLKNPEVVQCTWSAGLVHTVAETAVDLQNPYVLVHIPSGTAFVAVVVLGPVVLGAQLHASRISGATSLFWPDNIGELVPIIVSDPFLGEAHGGLSGTRAVNVAETKIGGGAIVLKATISVWKPTRG